MNDNITATKFQIMQESGINDYTWDIVTNRNNIKPVKNYMDENNRFCSVFDKQYVIEKINEFIKNNDNDLKECFNDKTLITIKKLSESWNISESVVRNRLKKANIKPFKIVELGYGRQCFLYKKSDCDDIGINYKSSIAIEQSKAVVPEKSEKQKELEKWLNDDTLIQRKELEILWKLTECGVRSFLHVNKIKPKHEMKMGHGMSFAFYDKHQCLFARQNKADVIHKESIQKYLNDNSLIQRKQLEYIWDMPKSSVLYFLRSRKIQPQYLFKTNNGNLVFYNRQQCLDIRNNEKEQKAMQTPDFIPADTLDIYTLDQLKAKIPGIENHYEMFNKSEVPEYQEIARMMRGNQKSVNLWGKMVEGIKKEVGAMVEVAPMYDENIKRFTVPDKYFVQNTDRLMTYREVSILLKESVGSLRNKVSCLSLKPTIINRKAYFNTNQVEMMRGKTVTDIKKDRLTELEEKVSELEQIVVKLKNSLQSLLK